MAEYIDREAALMKLMQDGCSAKNLQSISDMPAADVAQVVHGRWIMVDDSCGKYACSACREIEQECTEWGAGHYNPVYKDYCPNCGAKMDEPVGNSDRLEEATE